MQNSLIRIAFVDDHPLITEGLRTLLEKVTGLAVVGVFADGASLMQFLGRTTVDIVLVDIGLPDINGMELCKQIKTTYPGIVVLILSNHTERSLIDQSMENGANGYVLKNASLQQLKEAIFKAIAGATVYSPEVISILRQPAEKSIKEIAPLTKREKEILQYISEGKTSAQIAQQLYLSVLTVDTHRKNLMQKLKVKNAAEMIRAAARHRLLN